MVTFIPFIIKHQMKRSHTHIHARTQKKEKKKKGRKKKRETDWLKTAISVATQTEYNWVPGQSTDTSHLPKN